MQVDRIWLQSDEREPDEEALLDEVQRFAGWAMAKCLKKYRNWLGSGKPKYSIEFARGVVAMLEHSRLLHADAVLDDDYVKTCYPQAMQNRNLGGLYLLQRQLIPWARHLVGCIGRISILKNQTVWQ